ncbi:class F sortase [Streptomyces sp. SKN60]|uniref:class F sortase n=1 Tax=Streptomyces sp. SKN60 TaxID=2855506 RepID=UPI002247C8F2|nr:class F sortase [Streptomyces sp. SKN60]MCX2182567.1 class F sortase [Streptomyces sp. SKN60]
MAPRRSVPPRTAAPAGRAPARPRGAARRGRTTRRQRRLLRLARTVAVTLTLVVGAVWWAGDGEPAGSALAAGPAAHGAPAAAATAGADGANGAKGAGGASGGAGGSGRKAAAKVPAKPQPPPAPLARSRPTTLAVPAITIEAPVVGLGLEPGGSLATPPVDNPRVVGWYANGVTPGERGTAVVVGHRDTRTGPAIFLNLDSLDPGNTVRVARADGRVAVFTVDRVRTYAKSAFPDEEVYGAAKRPELRLITCGGAFDRKEGYASNIVVFAHLTGVDRQI